MKTDIFLIYNCIYPHAARRVDTVLLAVADIF